MARRSQVRCVPAIAGIACGGRTSAHQAAITEHPMTDDVTTLAIDAGVDRIRRHIFLCCDQSKPKCSDRDASIESWEYLKRRLKELKLTGDGGIYRTKADCLKV